MNHFVRSFSGFAARGVARSWAIAATAFFISKTLVSFRYPSELETGEFYIAHPALAHVFGNVIVAVACGTASTAAVDEDGSLFVCGAPLVSAPLANFVGGGGGLFGGWGNRGASRAHRQQQVGSDAFDATAFGGTRAGGEERDRDRAEEGMMAREREDAHDAISFEPWPMGIDTTSASASPIRCPAAATSAVASPDGRDSPSSSPRSPMVAAIGLPGIALACSGDMNLALVSEDGGDVLISGSNEYGQCGPHCTAAAFSKGFSGPAGSSMAPSVHGGARSGPGADGGSSGDGGINNVAHEGGTSQHFHVGATGNDRNHHRDQSLALGATPARRFATVPHPRKHLGGRWARIAVGAGGACFATCADTGELWAWGRGTAGQLGVGGKRSSPTPARVATLGGGSGRRCVHVSASQGGEFACAVDARGVLYSWGRNRGGELGHGHTNSLAVPRKVKALKLQGAVHSVACGSHFVIALTHHSTIFTSASAGGSGSGGSGGVVSEAERSERSDLERGASEYSLDGASASVGRRASSFGSFSSDVADGAGSSSPSSYVNGAHHFGKPQPQPCAASKGERGRNNSDGDSGCGGHGGHSGSGGGSGGSGSRRRSRRAAIAIKRAKENERELARECQRQRERGMTMGLSAFCALPTPDGSDGCPYDFGNFGVGAARDARAVADAAGSTNG